MPAVDALGSFQPINHVKPPQHCAIPTLSDTVDLPFITSGFSFTVAGTVKVTTQGGETLTIPSGALAIAVIHKLRITRIWSTGTTATGFLVFW
jgi:hypothetical protein